MKRIPGCILNLHHIVVRYSSNDYPDEFYTYSMDTPRCWFMPYTDIQIDKGL